MYLPYIADKDQMMSNDVKKNSVKSFRVKVQSPLEPWTLDRKQIQSRLSKQVKKIKLKLKLKEVSEIYTSIQHHTVTIPDLS